MKALDRDPNRRYQSARELRVDLQRLLSGGALATDTLHQSKVREIASRGRNRKLVLSLVGVLLVGLAIGFLIKRWLPASNGHQKILAVLPIETVGQDAATNALGLGLTETLTAQLVQASDSDSVQVVAPRDLRDQKVQTAADARREFGTDYVLESSLQRSGQVIRINCYLVDSRTHRQIAARTVEADANDTFKIQDEVVNAALDMLPGAIEAGRRKALAARQDTKPAAYEAYIRGRGYLLEYEKPENIDNAIAEFQQSIKVDPNYAPAYAGLGEAYLIGYQQFPKSADWVASAAKNCEQSLILNPQMVEGHICLGNVFNGTGKPDKAIVQFQRAVQGNANNEDGIRGLADAYTSLGNLTSAEAAYKQAISLRPKYWAVYSWLGYFYFTQNRYSDAAEMYLKATQLAPDNYHNYFNLGAMYVALGRYPEAINVSEHSLALRPSPDAYGNLGYTYFLMHKYSDAVASLKQALQLDPDDWQNWGNLGDALYWSPGRRAESAEQYRKAISLASTRTAVNPDDAVVLAYLASYSAMLDDRASALQYLQRALKVEPSQGEVLFQAAIVYSHFNDTEKTLFYLNKAVSSGYSRSVIRDAPYFGPIAENAEFRALVGEN